MRPGRVWRALTGSGVMLLVAAGACDGMSGVSDLEFGQGVGSPCWSDTDCDRDTYCAPGIHRCEYQQEIGAECLESNECKGDVCVDGVCCNAACDAACESCAVAGSVGTCTPHLVDTDPDDECPGTPTCNGASACVGQSIWALTYGDDSDQAAASVAFDSTGNLVVAGSFWGEVDFGGGVLASQGDADVFVAKFSPAGELIWSQRFGGDGNQTVASMVVDSQDRIVLGGAFGYGIQIGSTDFAADGYESEAYVAQLSADGTPLWAVEFDGTAGWQGVRDVAVDAAGNVAVAGMFSSDVTIGGQSYPWLPDHDDMFLVKLDAQGVVAWSHVYTAAGYYLDARSVGFDPSGNLLFGGDISTSIDLGQGPLTPDGRDIFLAKYNADGVAAWTKQFGAGNDQVLADLAVDSGGNTLLTGWFAGGMTFGGSELTSEGGRDIFLAKIGPAGGHQWSHRYGGAFDQEGRGVAVGAGDLVALTGMFTLGANFGTSDEDQHLCVGAADGFLAKFEPTGMLVWSQPFGGRLIDVGTCAALDSAGNAAVAGSFEDAIEFGGESFEGQGYTDGFVAVFAP